MRNIPTGTKVKLDPIINNLSGTVIETYGDGYHTVSWHTGKFDEEGNEKMQTVTNVSGMFLIVQEK